MHAPQAVRTQKTKKHIKSHLLAFQSEKGGAGGGKNGFMMVLVHKKASSDPQK